MYERTEPFWSGLKNRILLTLACHAPGATSWRIWLNRWRGAHIGKNVWIGYDAIIDTSRADLVTIRDGATVQIRAMIIAHFREQEGVVIEENAVIGAGAIILPNVTVGQGSIVTAGSVVTKSVPPKTMVQGNPARAIARVEVPFTEQVSLKEFSKGLRRIADSRPAM
jgi:serine acetyltransferase